MTVSISAVVFWLLTALASGFGAYFGAYLKKKGENLATHEDIAKLVDQVRAITTATKEIEAKISNDMWDRQKQWELKRDALFEATKAVGMTMESVTGLYSAYKASELNEETHIRTLDSWRAFGDSISKFDQAVAIASLVCSIEVQKLLFDWGLSLRSIVRDLGEGNTSTYESASKGLATKRTTINLALRRELGTGITPSIQ